VDRVAKDYNLKVIALDQDPIVRYRHDEHLADVDPEHFINIFGNASLVVTNSFHGTAFAINLSIPFVAVKPPSGGNRIESILSVTGLKHGYVAAYQDIERLCAVNEFESAHIGLDAHRESGFRYLDKCFNKVAEVS